MGNQQKGVIEINGKKYDTVTGKIIHDSNTPVAPVKTTAFKPGVVMDGFTKRSTAPAKPRKHDVTTPRVTVPSKKVAQKSTTLMRQAVKKPSLPHTKPSVRPVAAHAELTKSVMKPKPQRVASAQQSAKSPLVSRYSQANQHSSVIKKIQPLPVVTERAQSLAPAKIHATPKTQQPSEQSSHSTRSKATTALINKALASAQSHEHIPHMPIKHSRRKRLARKLGVSSRAMAVSSSVLAVVLLAGFFAIQNVPMLSMRVASTRAGFAASMPAYKPSGFSFQGPIKYSPGQVTVSFSSNTDDRSYSVTEESSNWNSDALLSNFIVAQNKQYQTYLDRGRTLYIYDGGNATWVDNGIWHRIEGNADMTTDQLVRIAASI